MSTASVRERVLVVDDEPQVLVALEDLLSDDFTVITTDSPETALHLVKSEPDIAVVLSDQRMPRMAGDELLARLASASTAARILVTGYADLTAVVRAVNEGRIFAYVTKPWTPDDLRLKVTKAAQHFRLTTELTHERQLLNRVLDSMQEGVIALDRSGTVLLTNPQAEQILGVRQAELDPETWLRRCGLYEPDQRTPLTVDALKLAMRGEHLEEREVFVRNSRIPGAIVTMSVAALHDDIPVPVGGIVVLRNITERRRLERQLTQAQKMEAIGLLAGGVAHDFNNMLAVITGYGELVLEALPEEDPIREDMLQLLGGANRAAGLTRQLLAFSRHQVVKPKILDLNGVVANVEKMLGRVIGEDISMRAELTPDLWPVKADPGQIEQILLNLTVNARDAMPTGGRLTIKTANVPNGSRTSREPLPEGDFVLMEVADTGTGMDLETQKRIFEPFFTTKDPGKGTGLGLSTVYGIIQQCGGQLQLQSTIGRGTTFEIYFPRARERVGSSRPAHPVIEKRPAPTASILLVEDEESVRQVTTRVLRNNGYLVLEAGLPSEAMNLLTQGGVAVDLLLVDVVMPEMTGAELAKQVSALQPSMKVLYMSGYTGGAISGRDVLGVGASYLEKPFTAAVLCAKVRDVLEGKLQQQDE
jgi:PAS domain S-box-containing protein